MNRINIFLEHLFELCSQEGITLEQALIAAADIGYTGLECDLRRLTDRSTAGLFSRCGLAVASVYAWYDFLNDTPGQALDKMRGHIATAELFGAKKIMAIPGFFGEGGSSDEEYDIFAQRLSTLCGLAAEHGMTVTVEDFDDVNSPCFNTKGLLRLLENAQGLRLTFDTGNFAYANENAADAYDRLKGYISHVHLKDRSRDISRANADGSNGKADIAGEMMYPCEVGAGYVGAEEIVKRLISGGYGGDFSVEHFGAVNQYEYMKRSFENITGWINGG